MWGPEKSSPQEVTQGGHPQHRDLIPKCESLCVRHRKQSGNASQVLHPGARY